MRDNNITRKQIEDFNNNERIVIAKRLKELRTAKHISQQEMAELINVSYGTYVKMENAQQNITIQRVLDICKILQISTDTLLKGEVEPSGTYNFERFLKLCDLFSPYEIDRIDNLVQEMKELINFKEKLN